MNNTITIPIDQPEKLADVVAGLTRNNLRFDVITGVNDYVITITGY